MFHCGVEFSGFYCLFNYCSNYRTYNKNRYNKLYPEQGVTYMESMKMWTKNADEGLKAHCA